MSISITITGDTPEQVAGQLAWAYAQFNSAAVIDAVKSVGKKAVAKPVQESAPPEVASEVAPASADDIPAPVAAVPSNADKAEVQKLASAKSKIVGAEKVKETIAKFGGKTINETSVEQMAALRAALEAL